MKSSIARYNYYLNQGIAPDKINGMVANGMVVSIDEVDKLIDARFDELQAQSPGASMEDILNKVKAEFGL